MTRLYLFVLLTCGLWSCTRVENAPTNLELNAILEHKPSTLVLKSKSTNTLDLEALITFKYWDSMVVLAPYNTGEKILRSTKNYSETAMFIEKHTLDEGSCTIVLLNKDNVVAYGVVKRNPFDFITLIDNDKGYVTIPRKDLSAVKIVVKAERKFLEMRLNELKN